MVGQTSAAPTARGASRSPLRWLGYLLGAFFIATGLLKLAGLPYEIVPGSAMLAHPLWFRKVVGVAEVICGALLFVPAAETFAAVGLALLMLGAAGSRLVIGAPGALYPAVLFVLLAVVAWAGRPDDVRAEIHRVRSGTHPVLRGAVIGGSLAAAAVALWFLILDSIAGRPLQTPLTLGRALLSVLGPAPSRDADLVVVAMYTLFHFAAFIAVAAVAEWVLEHARTQPAVLAGALILFVALEVAFLGLTAVLQEQTGLGGLAWWHVFAGNLIATAVLGTYIWRHHVELPGGLRRTLEGTA